MIKLKVTALRPDGTSYDWTVGLAEGETLWLYDQGGEFASVTLQKENVELVTPRIQIGAVTVLPSVRETFPEP